MIIFTNVRKSIDYKDFILLNVHPAQKGEATMVNKKVAEITLDDQILLFIVQREAIVDITGTLRVQR